MLLGDKHARAHGNEVPVDVDRHHRHSACEQLISRNVKRFRGGLVFKAHGLLYHSTLGSRVIKKERRCGVWGVRLIVRGAGFHGVSMDWRVLG